MLRMRIQSAAILIPVSLAAVWFGSPWLAIGVGVAGLAMGWEWGRLASRQSLGLCTAIVMAATAGAIAAAAADRIALALVVALAGTVAAGATSRGEWAWTAAGTLWIAGGCIAFLWLAGRGGRDFVFWLLAVVWATDIFAYLFGKALGGPRLVPQLSPNKTWAGFAGGLAGGVGAGAIAALWVGADLGQMALVSLGASLAAQGGDLAESGAKRHFAVKDTSGLIPGHGGVLDRLDGLLAATIALWLLTFVSKVHFG